MKIFLLIFVLGVTATVGKELWAHIKDNSEGSISCSQSESDRYIRINGADFNYDNTQTIPLDELKNVLPKIKCNYDFKRKVKQMCEGETSCRISVDRKNFPISECHQYKKVMYLNYDCITCSLDNRKKRDIGGNSSELMPNEDDEVQSRSKRQSGSDFCQYLNLQSTSKANLDEQLKKKIDKNIKTKEDFICPNDVFTRKHVCHNYGDTTPEVLQNCAVAKENNRGRAQWVSSNTYTLFVSSCSALIGYTQWSDMCKFVNAVPKFKCTKRGQTWNCNRVGNAIAHHNAQSGHYFHQFDIMSLNKK